MKNWELSFFIHFPTQLSKDRMGKSKSITFEAYIWFWFIISNQIFSHHIVKGHSRWWSTPSIEAVLKKIPEFSSWIYRIYFVKQYVRCEWWGRAEIWRCAPRVIYLHYLLHSALPFRNSFQWENREKKKKSRSNAMMEMCAAKVNLNTVYSLAWTLEAKVCIQGSRINFLICLLPATRARHKASY